RHTRFSRDWSSDVCSSDLLFLGSFELAEPIMVLTDLVVAAICFYAFYKLGRTGVASKIRLYLRIYFIGMGLATTFGGIVGHGLRSEERRVGRAGRARAAAD